MNRGSMGIFGNEKAMTMIEIMVVCVIMGITFLGVAGLFPLSTRNLSESRVRTVATDLAQQKMEALLTLKVNDTDLNAGSHTDPDNPVRTSMDRYWTITDNTPLAGMKKIEVRVTYPHGTTTRDVIMVTYKQS
ncbi:MAG: prepilin-type N-terminal cleavage/methylation domain-containing protein [Candidatus Eisenbacteria bacterium]